jgi:hypothetical protein
VQLGVPVCQAERFPFSGEMVSAADGVEAEAEAEAAVDCGNVVQRGDVRGEA